MDSFIDWLYTTVQNAYVLPTHTGICNIVHANIMWFNLMKTGGREISVKNYTINYEPFGWFEQSTK